MSASAKNGKCEALVRSTAEDLDMFYVGFCQGAVGDEDLDRSSDPQYRRAFELGQKAMEAARREEALRLKRESYKLNSEAE